MCEVGLFLAELLQGAARFVTLTFGMGKPLGGGECLILKTFDLLTQPCVLFPRRAG